jgi:hypothetical protein
MPILVVHCFSFRHKGSSKYIPNRFYKTTLRLFTLCSDIQYQALAVLGVA